MHVKLKCKNQPRFITVQCLTRTSIQDIKSCILHVAVQGWNIGQYQLSLRDHRVFTMNGKLVELKVLEC